MWPGGSRAWRRRQPKAKTKPRLGNTREPPPSPIPVVDSTDSILNIVELLGVRQLDDQAGDNSADSSDSGDDSDGMAAAAATTFNNGLWTPPAAASAASATLPALAATALSAMLSTDVSVSPSLEPALATSGMSGPIVTSMPASTMPASSSSTRLTLPSVSSSSASPTSSSSRSPSPTAISSIKASSSSGSSGGFKLIYLAPILIFVGLLLFLSVGGRIWGRIHHASRVEAARRAKYDKRASRQAKKREMQRIKTMWGYEQTPVLPPELEPGQHDLHYKDPSKAHSGKEDAESSFGSDSESGDGDREDERYPGTFKILSLALLGEGSKPAPPLTRGESGRKYEAEMQRSSWLAVKIKRWIRRDEQEAAAEDNRYTTGPYKASTAASRRLRHTLSRDWLRADEWQEKHPPFSPATTLSVGSGEMKHKAEFEAVDLDHPAVPDTYFATPPRNARYASVRRANKDELEDPFTENTQLGWRKPLPPQPKESPFRPAILNFGLRSRSKTYDAVSPHANAAAAAELDTPQKSHPNTSARYLAVGAEEAAEQTGGWTLGLGISGVWKAMTALASPRQPANEEDEESFVARPYGAHAEVMSESDTPYSQRRYAEVGTPTRAAYDSTPTKTQLNRTGTVLNVKSNTNQPWNERKITAAAWNEALLSSPPNKLQQATFQPLAQPSPKALLPIKTEGESKLAPRKSLLLHQAISAKQGVLSPAFTDYSDLVACYSTPSDAMISPEAAAPTRAVPAPVPASDSRTKLQRAKTAKMTATKSGEGVQRSKTASTAASKLGPGLSRKGTVHHSVLKKQPAPSQEENAAVDFSTGAGKGLYPFHLTQPLRVSKQDSSEGAVSIPRRGSSSPSKSSTVWPPSRSPLPTALRIASPDPIPLSNPHHHSHSLSFDVSSAYSQEVLHQGFASFHPQRGESEAAPRRAKAVSNRSVEEEGTMARGAVQKAQNRSRALEDVDQIVFQSYQSQMPPK